MGLLSWIMNSNSDKDEYDRGYDAAEELHNMIDHEPSDEEWDAHCKVVKANHSDEYIEGYADYLEDASKPWYKFW